MAAFAWEPMMETAGSRRVPPASGAIVPRRVISTRSPSSSVTEDGRAAMRRATSASLPLRAGWSESFLPAARAVDSA